MSRRRDVPKRVICPDPRFGDPLVAKFINGLMLDGKKSVARQTLYKAMELMESRAKSDSFELFKKAVENVKPMVEVKSRRVGGATYQVPVEVRPGRRMALAMRWAIDAARKRGETSMPRKLAAELLEASENRGGAIKKREETHRMAEANKAFSHYRW